MGSNQSSLADRNNSHARHSHQREKNKNKKPHVTSVNSGGAYEHLACTNDNSARSSPANVHGSSSSLKDAVSKKSPSVTCFPCFSCISNDELNSRGVPIPGQNSDSVALLRISSKLSLHAAEPEGENNSPAEKSEPHAGKKLEDVVVEQKSCKIWAGNPTVKHVGDMDGALNQVVGTEVVRSEVVVNGSSIFCEKNGNNAVVQPDESDLDFDQVGSGKRFLVSKKYLSFPCSLFSRQKSRPEFEGYSNRQLAVMPMREQLVERRNERANEIDCMSNGTSCEDSGKASESESGLLTLEPGRNICKAPIAKIDSLEATSIDSLNSDDLMLDTVGFSCTSIEELARKGCRDPVSPETAGHLIGACKSRNLNHSSNTRNSLAKDRTPDRLQLSCSSLSEPKLNKQHSDACDSNERWNANNDILACGNMTLRDTVDRDERSKMTFPGSRERKRMSCPSTGTELPFLWFDSLQPTSFEVTDVNRLPTVIQEMPDLPMPVDNECMILDRETHDELRNEIETCRTLLLDLGVIICQDEINNSSYLDSKNNNLGDMPVQEDAGKNSLQTAGSEMKQESPSYEQLAMENDELRTKVMSLQILMIEQQGLIATLENKLAQLRSSRQKAGRCAAADVHSTPVNTSG